MGGKNHGGARIKRADADSLIQELQVFLSEYCKFVMPVGSHRRCKPELGDIDLVVVPRASANEELTLLAALGPIVACQLRRLEEAGKPNPNTKAWEWGHGFRKLVEDGAHKLTPADVACAVLFGAQKSKPVPARSGLVKGAQVEVYVATDDDLGTQLIMWTGSMQENVRLRSVAMGRGWKLNQYGVFEGDKPLSAGMNEREVYALLGEKYREPEERG